MILKMKEVQIGRIKNQIKEETHHLKEWKGYHKGYRDYSKL
jgi:hypothetical protein